MNPGKTIDQMKIFIQILILYLIIFSASLTKVFGQCAPNNIQFVGSQPIYNFACGNSSYQKITGSPLTGSGQAYSWQVSFAGGSGSNVPITTSELSSSNITDFILTPNSHASGDYKIQRIVTDDSPICTSVSDPVFLYYVKQGESPSGGTISGLNPICSGTSGTLTLQGHTGPVLQWESASTNAGPWIPIASTTGYQYSYLNLPSSTCFRALVDNICGGNLGGIDLTDKYSGIFCVTVNPLPQGSLFSNGICLGGVEVGRFTFIATAGTGPFTLIINDVPYLNVESGIPFYTSPSPTSTTEYTLTSITDAKGCVRNTEIDGDIATISVYPVSVGGTVSSNATVCSGTNSGTLTLSGHTGNVVRWESSTNGWSTITTIANTTNSQAYTALTSNTQYRAVVKNPFCPAVNSSVAIITVNPLPSVSVNSLNICANVGSNTMTASPSGGTGPYSYSWTVPSGAINPNNNVDFTATIPGTYSVIATDFNGCSSTAGSTTITINAALSATITSQVNVLCFGQTTGSVVITPAGGTPTYTITPTQSGLAAGLHTFTVTDANLCTTTVAVTITQPAAALSATITSQVNVLCFGQATGSVVITPAGGTSTYTITPTQSGLAAGLHTFTVTDANLCTTTVAVTITQPAAALSASLSNTTIISCLTAAQLTISAVGGTMPYTYSTDGVTYTNTTIYNVGPGTYTYYVRDVNGCAAVMTNMVTIVPIPALQLNLNLSNAANNCAGDNTASIVSNASGGLGNYSYILFDNANNILAGPQASGNFTGLVAGSYIVRVDSDDCFTVSSVINIVDPTSLIVAPFTPNPVLCIGGNTGSVSVAASGGTGIIKYAISPNLSQFFTSGIFLNLAAGNYDLIVQDQLGCFQLFNFDIIEPAALNATIINVNQELCLNDANASFDVNITGGTAPYSTSLNSNNPANFVLNQLSFSGLTGGQTYTIYVRDANGCTTSTFISLTTPVSINATVAVAYNCTNNFVGNTVTVSVNPAVFSNVTYSLNGSAFQANNVFTNVATGNGHIIRIRHINMCERTVTFDITPPPAIQVNYLADPVSCNGQANGRITILANGGSGGLQYAISPNLTSFSPINSFNNLAAGTYTVMVRDNIFCEITLVIIVTQPNILTATINTVIPDLCAGDNVGAIQINITGGNTPYLTSLNNTNNFVANQVLFVNLTGGQTYTIYVRDNKGCVTQISVPLPGGVVLNPSITRTYGCATDAVLNTVRVNVNPAEASQITYSLNGGVYQTNAVFTNVPNGLNSITVLHSIGCFEVLDFTINNYSLLTLTLVESFVNQITATGNGGNGGYIYAINEGSFSSQNVFNITQTGTYTVTVRDSLGCTAVQTIYIEFIDIDIPNFFTPNDDGTNDTWAPINSLGFQNIKVKLTDRYGRILKEFGQTGSWDGTYNGNPLPSGDYWYIISLGDGRQMVGNVTLYR